MRKKDYLFLVTQTYAGRTYYYFYTTAIGAFFAFLKMCRQATVNGRMGCTLEIDRHPTLHKDWEIKRKPRNWRKWELRLK